MPCLPLCPHSRFRVTRGVDGEVVAIRGLRGSRRGFTQARTKGANARVSAKDPALTPADRSGGSKVPRLGQTSARRTDRSRKKQRDHILDHYQGYVLAHHLGGFFFLSLRTPTGTTVQQGHTILVRFRTGLAKRFPYVDGLVLQRSDSDDTLTYVHGRGWHAHWTLERSLDASPHYHIMVATFGYDAGKFRKAVKSLWPSASESVLGRDLAHRRRDLHIGRNLGAQTVRYMYHPKDSHGRNVTDFSEVLGEGQPLGSNWWNPFGRPCLALVRGHGEFLDDESLSELRERALRLHEVEWNGRPVPDRYAHYVHRRTGRLLYLVSGPWLGAAAQYLATGLEHYLHEYSRARRHAGGKKRREEAEHFATEFGL